MGWFSKFTLFVDNNKLGTVSNGKTESFKISPGAHAIYIKGAFWSKSKVIEIQALAGRRMSFECGIAKSYIVLLLCFMGLLVIENVLLNLSRDYAHLIGPFNGCPHNGPRRNCHFL